ncbi:MAG: hypothetical protein CSA96_03200 [Bacteroidetes bacterium]|nr:MAG: hypothetical protein CSA96_03200 [Bacteroidota bacterium]
MEQCKITILAKSRSGKIFRCLTCNRIHIEFNNLYFTFTNEQFNSFRDYFLELDIAELERQCLKTPCMRKIMIPFQSFGFHALFHASEIRELQMMLLGKTEPEQPAPSDIGMERFPEFSMN